MLAAIIVTFKPDAETFQELLCSLAPQADALYIVDNSPRDADQVGWVVNSVQACCDKSSIIRFGENLGIAAALNEGIVQAIRDGAKFVLLSDQDSSPASNMVEALEHQFEEITNQGFSVGAIGPSFTDINAGVVSNFQVSRPGRWFYGHKTPSSRIPNIEVLTLITSGLLIPTSVFEDVGLMREDLFIDHVDIDWSHRARSKGYSLFGTWHAKMQHRMGESEFLRVWYFGWRNESYYKPERHYYRFRNLVALWRSDYIDLSWKIRNTWYWLGFLYSHLFFGPSPLASFRMAIRGVMDGLRGNMGRYRH